jgi:plastocyanin
MRRTLWIALVGLGVGVAGLVAGSPRGAWSAPAQIDIAEFRFAPTALEVPVGTSVTWINEDDEPHTVTSTAGAFGSKGLDHAEHYVHQFTAPGTYRYFCALHPRMTGTVIVK